MADTAPPPPETVKRSRTADVSAERSRGISSGDLSEECALAEDGGVAAAVRLLAVSSKAHSSARGVAVDALDASGISEKIWATSCGSRIIL